MADAGNSSAHVDDLADIDRCMIDGALLLYLVGDEIVLAVEKQDAELLGLAAGHGGGAVIEKAAPAGERRPVQHLATQHPHAGGMDQLQIDDGLAAAFPFTALSRSGEAASTSAKLPNRARSSLANGLSTPRDGTGEEELEQLVVEERVGARLHEPGAQPLAMAEIVRWLARFLGFAPGFRLAEAIPRPARLASL